MEYRIAQERKKRNDLDRNNHVRDALRSERSDGEVEDAYRQENHKLIESLAAKARKDKANAQCNHRRS